MIILFCPQIKMEAITLTYFNFTGRAELARLILAYAGAK